MTSRSHETLIDVLARRAQESPHRTLFRFLGRDGSESAPLTFAELDWQARNVALSLAHRKLQGERVLLLHPPGRDYIIAFLGCLYAGAIAVPLFPPTGSRTQRHSAVVASCDPAAAIVPSNNTAAMEFLAETGIEALSFDASVIAASPDDWQHPRLRAESLAFLQYTSGSTASPRGVMVSHGNLMANSAAIQRAFGTSADVTTVSWLPPYHDMGLIGGILQPIYAGCETTILSPAAFVARPALWLKQISERQAAISGGPDFAYEHCVKRIKDEELEGVDLSSWRLAFSGAEPIRAATLQRFADRMAPYGFTDRAFLPCYGLAEATLLVSAARPSQGPVQQDFEPESVAPGQAAIAGQGPAIVSCGQAPDGVHIAVVDSVGRKEFADGTVGEIWVAGDAVASGYWGQATQTAHTFGARLPRSEESFLRTGDLGFVHNGELFITGRAKDLIIVRGRNHYPHDLEQVAASVHDGIRASAAFAYDSATGEEICLVLELHRKGSPDVYPAIVRAARAAVAQEHQTAPAKVVLVAPGGIPRTSSGKVQRSLTRDRLGEGQLPVLYQWDGQEQVEFSTLPALWSGTVRDCVIEVAGRLLGGTIDPASSLVQQGMDSLIATEIKAAVAAMCGVNPPLEALLAGASIDDLFTIDAASTTAPSAATASSCTGLSANEQALWFLEQQHPGTAVQHISAAVRIRPTVDPVAMRGAFQALVNRHPALRTAFRVEQGVPHRHVFPTQDVSFTVESAWQWSEAELRNRMEQAAGESFDLTQGKLLRGLLLRRDDGDVLVLVLHHIAADLWTVAMLIDELSRAYQQLTGPDGGTAPPAQEIAHPGAPEPDEKLWSYWRDQLADCNAVVELPTDRPRPRVQSFRGDSVPVRLDAALTRQLRQTAAATDTTLFASLLTVFETLIHRYTKSTDFLVGVPTSGRSDPARHQLAGYLVNPVLIRCQVTENDTFSGLLRRTGKTVVDALVHQDMPFPAVVERLRLQRDASRPPGYQVLFTLNTPHRLRADGLGAFQSGRPAARMRLGDLELESLELPRRTSQIELTMVLTEHGDELEGFVDFATDLFDRTTIKRLVEHFVQLASQLSATPDAPLADASMATEAELRLVVEWNQTDAVFPEDSSVVTLFADQVRAAPHAPAVSYGDVVLSYQELDRVTNALARRLRAHGVTQERAVGLAMDRDICVIVAMLAVAKAGGCYVPLDPAHPPARLQQVMSECQPAVVLTQGGQVPAGLRVDEPVLKVIDVLSPDVMGDSANDAPVGPPPHANSLLYMMYTSGSSGVPKGICITHRNVLRLVCNTDYITLKPGSRIAQISNIAFDGATLEIWGSLLSGGHLVGFGSDTVLSPPRLAAALRAADIQIVVMATPLFARVAAYDPATFATVQQLFVGGDTLDPKWAREVAALGGPILGNGYGPTETTTFATVHHVSAMDSATVRLPIGKPITNTYTYVLDKCLRPLPIGVPGELYIGGPGVGRCYLAKPGLTASRFVPDPFAPAPGARMYATGDVARWRADGTIDFLGRADFQVKVRGYRIELHEIDATMLAHPQVNEAVTIVDESTQDKRLIGYFSGPPTADEVNAFLRERLPSYMVPAVLVRLAELPKNPNQKLDRAKLPPPDQSTKPIAVGQWSDREREISELMAGMLGLSSLQPDENFFDIGGYSLLAIRLMTELRDRYGVEVPLHELFSTPTAAAVASYIDATIATAKPAPTQESGPVALQRTRYARVLGSAEAS